MANPNAPFGLRPVRHLFGGQVRENAYTIADQYGSNIFLGDPVVCTGTGKNIQIATAGTSSKISGVFMGCEFVDSSGDSKFLKYWPTGQVTKGAAGAKALIVDDPHVVFEIMFDNLLAADIRALANLVAGTGSTLTGQSAWTAVKPPGSGENQIKIYGLGVGTNPGGVANAYGTFAVAEVMLSQHEMGPAMANL